jgi:multiple sugar transport system permease protein
MWASHEPRYHAPRRWQRRAKTGLWWTFAIAISAIFVAPLLWTISVSLRETGQPLPRSLELLPEPVSPDNYRRVFSVVAFARFAVNSLFVAAVAVPLTVVIAAMAGFATSQLSRAWRLRLTAISFVALMVPLTALWLPRFIMIKEAGLIDSRWSLIVPAFFGTSPFYVLLFAWAFLRIPPELFEAARLDGAGPFRMLGGIALPLSLPAIMAVTVLAFVMTLPLGLQALLQLDRTNWPLLMAGAVMVTAPVILVFLVAQRAFLQDRPGSGRVVP